MGYRNQNSKERCKWKICNDRSKVNEGKADEMDGSFKFTEDGTYRVVKDVYGYMSSMRNFLFEAKSNEVTIENKKEDKKEDKTTATTSTSQIATIKKKETQIVKPLRVVKLKVKKSSKRSVKISWKKQKNVSVMKFTDQRRRINHLRRSQH